MEVRVYFKDGSVEAHHMPEYVGNSSTVSQDFGGSETYSEIDRVRGIAERFVRDAEGFWLERRLDKLMDVRMGAGGKFVKDKGNNATRTLVVPQNLVANVKYILLDGEQVYPEEEQEHEDSYAY